MTAAASTAKDGEEVFSAKTLTLALTLTLTLTLTLALTLPLAPSP